MKKVLLALLLGSALVLGACGNNNNDKTTTNESKTTGTTKVDAEAVTKQKCISCHGGDLSGSVGPDLRKIGATLSEKQIKDVLKNGKGNMPGGLVTGDELNAVAKWLSEKK